MNPEEYLEHSRARKPGPFLRQNVLEEAERAWREEPRRRSIRQVVFHPMTAAASVAFAFGLAVVSSEIDSRATASLVGDSHQGNPVEDRGYFAGNPERYESQDWLWDDELADAFAWNGIGMGYRRESPEEPEPTRDRGT